jgi:hypothetical protein
MTIPSVTLLEDGDAFGEAVGDLLGVGFFAFGVGEGFLTTTPLFQTSLLPDLMQVNFFPATVDVAPAFVHLAPALAAAKDGPVMRDMDNKRAMNKRERVMR